MSYDGPSIYDGSSVKDTLPRSLCPIARLALRDDLATGFAIDQLALEGERWIRRWSEGVPMPAPDSQMEDYRFVCFPLGERGPNSGALSFASATNPFMESEKRLLGQVAEAVQGIWLLWHAHEAYVRSIVRIAELEAELADTKITDRATALLERRETGTSQIGAILASVNTIVRHYQLRPVLEEVAQDLERDLADHRLLGQAKSVLQNRDGMSEEQAYLHLRLVSRQTRRRIHDIAGDLVERGIVPRRRDAGVRRRA